MNLWLLWMKRVRVYARLTGKLHPCSAGEEQEDWDACDPLYVTAGGVDVVLLKAPVLVFVAGCISVLCMSHCACTYLVPLLLPGPGVSASAPVRLEQKKPPNSGRALHLTSLNKLAS